MRPFDVPEVAPLQDALDPFPRRGGQEQHGGTMPDACRFHEGPFDLAGAQQPSGDSGGHGVDQFVLSGVAGVVDQAGGRRQPRGFPDRGTVSHAVLDAPSFEGEPDAPGCSRQPDHDTAGFAAGDAVEMSGGLGSGDSAHTTTQQTGPQQRLPRGPPEAHNAVGDVHPSPAGQPTDNGTAHPSCGELGSRENPSLGARTTTEWLGKDGSGGHIVIMGGEICDSPGHLPPVENTVISTTYCRM